MPGPDLRSLYNTLLKQAGPQGGVYKQDAEGNAMPVKYFQPENEDGYIGQSEDSKLPTTDIEAQKPNWMKYESDFDAQNKGPKYDRNLNNPLMRKSKKLSLKNEAERVYGEDRSNYIAQQLLAANPQGNRDRVSWMNSFNPTEREKILSSGEAYQLQPSDFASAQAGATSHLNYLTGMELQSPYVTKEEQEQRGALNVFDVANVPGKVVRSIYRDQSIADALQGKQADERNVGFIERGLTDLAGDALVGGAGKLANAKKLNLKGGLNKALNFLGLKGTTNPEVISNDKILSGANPDNNIEDYLDSDYKRKISIDNIKNTIVDEDQDIKDIIGPPDHQMKISRKQLSYKLNKLTENKNQELIDYKTLKGGYDKPFIIEPFSLEDKVARLKANKQKFVNTKTEFNDYSDGDPKKNLIGGINLERKIYYNSQDDIDNFDKLLNDNNKNRQYHDYDDPRGGQGGYGQFYSLFKNSEKSDIAKSHVMNHEYDHFSMRNSNKEFEDYKKAFDTEKMQKYFRSMNGIELRARIGQLFDYFQFKPNKNNDVLDQFGNKEFTIEHLKYAKQNYIKDVGMDNNMSEFFDNIKDEKKFLEIANKYAFGLTGVGVIAKTALQNNEKKLNLRND